MRVIGVLAGAIVITAGFASLAWVSHLYETSKAGSAFAGPVVGELVYWKDGRAISARVLKHTEQGVKILEAKQTDLPLRGILITRVVFPECGTLKFQQYDLGEVHGFAEAEEAEKYPHCPIKDWSGTWRIGRII